MNNPDRKPVGAVWKVALGGTVAILIAGALELTGNTSAALTALRVLLTAGGALAIGIALYLRPGHASLYGLACGAAILSRFGFPPEWDSAPILSGLAAIVAGIGAVLAAAPLRYRKIVASALVLFHFGGIMTAVTGPGSPPWLSSTFGLLVYRPYLQCMYLTNAYHFYSPEPGPASQVWFCIKYKPDASGTAHALWYKFPRRPQDMTDPLALSYYRRLSLTMQLESFVPGSPVTDEMKRSRLMIAQGANGIPIHPEFIPLENQYRLPTEAARDFILPSYVRHVVNDRNLHVDDQGRALEVDTIMVYRVEHRILHPTLLQLGVRPYDPTTYLPFYLGEYDRTGRLVNPGDPLLYWVVPIIYVPNPKKGDIPPWHTPKDYPDEFILIDGVYRHTGSDPNFGK